MQDYEPMKMIRKNKFQGFMRIYICLMENTEEANKPAEKERTSIKVWSENLQRYYYKSKNPNYYNE